jgi:hypothetical protein
LSGRRRRRRRRSARGSPGAARRRGSRRPRRAPRRAGASAIARRPGCSRSRRRRGWWRPRRCARRCTRPSARAGCRCRRRSGRARPRPRLHHPLVDLGGEVQVRDDHAVAPPSSRPRWRRWPSAAETLGISAISRGLRAPQLRDAAAQVAEPPEPQLVPGGGAHGVPERLELAQVAHGAARERAERAGVQVGARGEDRELVRQRSSSGCGMWLMSPSRSSSSSVSTARRRCGMTMEPPTTRPTEKASNNSVVGDALLLAAHQVVGDAVVAAQHRAEATERP